MGWSKWSSWFKGLIIGFVIYLIGVLIVYITSIGQEFGALAVVVSAMYFLPVVLLGALIGFIVGLIKKRR